MRGLAEILAHPSVRPLIRVLEGIPEARFRIWVHDDGTLEIAFRSGSRRAGTSLDHVAEWPPDQVTIERVRVALEAAVTTLRAVPPPK